MTENAPFGNPMSYDEQKEEFTRRMDVLVENADELFDFIKKAQKQSFELKKTLSNIEKFNPYIKLNRPQ